MAESEFVAREGLAKYELLEDLGAAGPAVQIRRARDPALGRTVVLKMLRGSGKASTLAGEDLLREGRLLAEFSSARVVTLHELIQSDESGVALVLEDVDGPSLAHVIREVPQVPPAIAAHIARELAEALAHIHARGWAHCDLKPDNILLTNDGHVKLIDFGAARLLDDLQAKPAREAFGTPAYMSPEQILGAAAGEKGDLYSLGICLYEMLAGERPFGKEARARKKGPPRLRSRNPKVPAKLDAIVHACLAELPADRPKSAEALRGQLALLGDSSEATVHTFLERARLVPASSKLLANAAAPPKATTHRRTILGFLTLFLLVVVGGALIRLRSRGSEHPSPELTGRLELVPEGGGTFRAIVTPWANVWIDGEFVETTPFAAALPLAAGNHYVAFRHPNAPDEKRTISVHAGEQVFLDITMQVGARAGAVTKDTSRDASAAP